MIKKGKDTQVFSTGAVRSCTDENGNLKGRMDLLPWDAIILVSKRCEEGALNKNYGEHNVDKGIPQHSLVDSCLRHLAKYVAGYTDEDHLTAAAWNVLWALNQTVTHKELLDVPWMKNKENEYVSKRELIDYVCTKYDNCEECPFWGNGGTFKTCQYVAVINEVRTPEDENRR